MTSCNYSNNKIISRELQIVITKQGIISDITSNCYDILGYTKDELLNTPISNYSKFDLNNVIENTEFDVEFTKKGGLCGYFNVHATPLLVNDKIENFSLSIINITKYKELEKRHEFILRMVDNSKDLICRLELIPKLKFSYLSPSIEDFFGYTVEECVNNPMLPFEIVHSDDKEIQFSKIKPDTDFSKLFQARMKHKDGHYIWIEDYVIPYFDENKQLIAVNSISRNIQAQKELEQRLEKLGYIDNLTELYNKNYLLREIDLLNNKVNMPIGIIVCDLDNLKYTNDSLGHSKGDLLIQNTATVLKSVFDDQHVISRTGGDEFVIIVKNKTYTGVKELYTKLQTAIKIFNNNNKTTPIKISIGVAYSETSISKIQYTLEIADNDMYNNKKQNKF